MALAYYLENMISTDLQAIFELMSRFPALWWVCGGWALDLYLNRITRPHKDIDITILRPAQVHLHDYLTGWTLDVAANGTLEPWQPDNYIELPRHIIWCQNLDHKPDFLEILLNEGDEQYFYFRRNQAIRRERAKAFSQSTHGLPFLAPEIVLLYKSKTPDDDDTMLDFTNTLPHLNHEQRDWLCGALRQQYDLHPWLDKMETITDDLHP